MSTRRALRLAPLLLTLASCQRAAIQHHDSRDDVTNDALTPHFPDIRPFEDRCQPGCHWDCFAGGGLTCFNNNVYQLLGGSVPCCRTSDPWPFGNGPPCTRSSVYGCSTVCQTVDTRYAHCFAQRPFTKVSPLLDHILKLACAEAKFASPGDPCDSDDQCRPMAPSVSARLVCDLKSHKCALVQRPSPPVDFGSNCGLAAGDVLSEPTDSVVGGQSCSLCHIAKESTCVRQGCTMPCQFDEDCPTGTVCVCTIGRSAGMAAEHPIRQVCAAASDRSTVEGRTAGLLCYNTGPDPSAKDAGN